METRGRQGRRCGWADATNIDGVGCDVRAPKGQLWRLLVASADPGVWAEKREDEGETEDLEARQLDGLERFDENGRGDVGGEGRRGMGRDDGQAEKGFSSSDFRRDGKNNANGGERKVLRQEDLSEIQAKAIESRVRSSDRRDWNEDGWWGEKSPKTVVRGTEWEGRRASRATEKAASDDTEIEARATSVLVSAVPWSKRPSAASRRPDSPPNLASLAYTSGGQLY
jgi:hypothetical protein